jgi:hypothetical protein
VRLRFEKRDGRSDSQPARKIAARIEQRPVPDHPQAGVGSALMDSSEGEMVSCGAFFSTNRPTARKTGAAVQRRSGLHGL